jgi:carbon monoxide dehydrogenase subunit G
MARTVVERVFDVAVPPDEAWRRLAEVERWPEWAPHITSVTVTPPGPLTPASSGSLRLRRLGTTTFRMSAWEPPLRWEWTGGIPGLRILYDHRFTANGDRGATTLTWTVSLDGPLAPAIRPLFARVYGRNVDRAIPRLQEWIRT